MNLWNDPEYSGMNAWSAPKRRIDELFRTVVMMGANVRISPNGGCGVRDGA